LCARGDIETSICRPHTLIAFPLSLSDGVAPALARAFVVFVRVFATYAQDSLALSLVSLVLVFGVRGGRLFSHCGAELAWFWLGFDRGWGAGVEGVMVFLRLMAGWKGRG
jgi:hypothetical protein